MSRKNWSHRYSRAVLAGQIWVRPDDGPVRIMSVIEGWVLLRRKGAAPYLITVKELDQKYTIWSKPKEAPLIPPSDTAGNSKR